ncbi:MAG: TAXI family TRAP transporter solute-binding subunit [Alphaproteobacteria bacterium]|nr:TAXI family TRAP transporter solute-binding subunit [Alphaproteobacteria bacterium]
MINASNSARSRREALKLGALGGAIVLLPIGAGTLAQGRPFRWGSGSLGSSGYVIIEALAQACNKHSGLRHSAVSTNGAPENMALMGEGELDLGQTTSVDWLPASRGEAPYRKPVKPTQLFAYAIWQNPIAVPESSAIRTNAELAGKRVSVGPAAGAGHALYKSTFGALGLYDKVNWVFGSWKESYDAVKARAVDGTAAILVGGEPAAAIIELETSVKLRALPISKEEIARASAANPGIGHSVVTPKEWPSLRDPTGMATYSGIVGARESVTPEIAYKITKAVFDNAEEIRRLGPMLKLIELEFAVRNLMTGFPVNAGAAQYFKEKGMWRNELTVVG